jgi:hypothetical protein
MIGTKIAKSTASRLNSASLDQEGAMMVSTGDVSLYDEPVCVGYN